MKGPVLEHASSVNVLSGIKNGWNLHSSIFLLLFHQSKIYWVGKLLSKIRSAILGPFANTLTADHKYSCHNKEKFWQPVQIHLSKKPKTFCGIFIALLKSIKIFSILKKKKTPFGSQRFNGCQTLLKSTRQHFYPTFSSIWDKLNWKTTPLVRFEILEFFQSLVADRKYSRHKREIFPAPVQMKWSKKLKIFC